ncbi:MAG: GNAT family N-acetyltransferase [Chloroflexi bacterium]|nr:MAG: GNAT family N-acetyltransferase [Chloroflexota bacterium]TME48682.1 MAG: GNAT family N-acetyltransferase [Chloroflexota bacterium]
MPSPGAGPAIAAPSDLELRPVRPEEQRAYSTVMRRAFGASLPTDEELAASREITEFDRTLAFFDGPEIVATAGIFSYELTVPGGLLPCAGVTRVSVLSTHRRRGLLTAMMRRQLDDIHERGEPLAALYASEAPIYGRFGYGLATYQASVEVQRAHATFGKTASANEQLSLVDVATAVPAFTRAWEQSTRGQPGMLRLDERWVRNLLADLELHREGASPHYRVLYQDDTGPSGFAIYRIKMDWDASGPNGTLRLEMLIAASPEAYAALWRHVLGVDLTARVTAEMRPIDEPLRFLLADSRQPKTRVEDGLWVRLVDVLKALAGRRYAVDDRLVFGVRDQFCPWNRGRIELQGGPNGAQARSTTASPDLELDAADLGAVYLSGNRFWTLQRAGRITELRQGAVARADAMFAADRVPWCPSHF